MQRNRLHKLIPSCTELESQLGDTMYEALDRESEIIHRLQEVVLEQSSELVAVMDVAAELDWWVCVHRIFMRLQRFRYPPVQ